MLCRPELPYPKKAHAFTLNKVEECISSLAVPLVEHLVKLALMPQDQARGHWKMEIMGWIDRIAHYAQNVKTPAKRVKASTLERWLLEPATEQRIANLSVIYTGGLPGDLPQIASRIQNNLRRVVPLLLVQGNDIRVILRTLTGNVAD